MKMNWGIKIAILYSGFVLLIVSLVSLSFGVNSELESKDYYAKELLFQDRIYATQNENKLINSINYKISNSDFILEINPAELNPSLTGKLFFYRPSDTSLDKEFTINFDNLGHQAIQLNQFKSGVYKVQISWENNAVKYYKEGAIYIK
jgi:hypothetical protein